MGKFFVFIVLLLAILAGAYYYIIHSTPEAPPEEVDESVVLFDSAENFYQENPDNLEEAIARYQDVVDTQSTNEVVATSQQQIINLNKKLLLLVDEAWAQLEADVNELLDMQKAKEAIILLRNYEGPHANQLAKRCNTLSQTISQEVESKQKAEADQLQRAESSLQTLISSVVDALYLFDFDTALQQLETAQQDASFAPVQQSLDIFYEEAYAICQYRKDICNTYSRDLNKVISVKLKKGSTQVTIKKVDGLIIHAERIIMINGQRKGSTPVRFTFNDLSLSEHAKRLSKATDDISQIKQSLLLIRAKKYQHAAGLLKKVNSILTLKLQEKLNKQLEANQRPTAPKQPVFEPDENNELIIL